jgi:hypothetical protein
MEEMESLLDLWSASPPATYLNVNCGCGTRLGTHWCTLDWKNAPPTYTRDEVLEAVEYGFDGVLPDYVWSGIFEYLQAMKS